MNKKPTIVFLDSDTVDIGDINLSELNKIGNYRSYSQTKSSQVISRAKDAEIIIANKILFDQKILHQLPHLKLIALTATGMNNVDLEECKKRNIKVKNVAGYSTITVAEHALMFILNFSHRLLDHHQASINGSWSQSSHFTWLKAPFSDLAEKTLGIIGYGNIGKRVSYLAKAFGMKIMIAKIPGQKYSSTKIKRNSLNEVLKKSDFISLHCPLTEKTRHLINQKTLKRMKPHSYLINLARGPIVNESDVAHALMKKQLLGYATDVTEIEPIEKNNPLLKKSIRDKVIITPHIAWGSIESRQRLMNMVIQNIKDFFN